MPRLVSGLEQIFTNLGIVGDGYKLFFFETTTTTPKTTYSDPDLQVANPNPVECDEAGRPEYDIWGADPATYKMVLGTPDSVIGNINPIVTVDPVDDLNTDSIINLNPLPVAYWGTTTGTSTNYELEALVPITSYSNKQCFLVDFHTASSASPNININEIGAINLKKYDGNGTKVAIGAGDIQAQRYLAINDGTDIVIITPTVRTLKTTQTFTSSGTWTKPTGCIAVEVWVVGGGGGSGGAQPGTNMGNASGGGGGGGCAYKLITSGLGATETVTIGAGGSAGATNGNGGTGGTSSFGSHCSATGGAGSINGNGNSGSQVGGAGGAGGVGSSGSVNLTGSAGGTGCRAFSIGGIGGNGGRGAGSFGGDGAAAGATTNTGIAGVAGTANTGGGAAGAAADYNAGSSFAGAAGGSGIVVVKEYY